MGFSLSALMLKTVLRSIDPDMDFRGASSSGYAFSAICPSCAA